MVRAGRQKVLVTATLENRQENAYNTSLSVSFSKNLHLTSLSPQVQGMGGGEKGGLLVMWKSCPVQLPHSSSQRDAGGTVKVECMAPNPHAQLCSVGHPVFQTGAKVYGLRMRE